LEKLSSNIIVTGFVEDVRPYLAKSKIAVMPIRIARGIQNKILEAMAMALPIIVNEKLSNSLNKLDKNDVFIYEDAKDLINIVLDNIYKDALLREMGAKMRKYVMKNYCWETNLGKMADNIKIIDT
jgi:glycosyltransferase involved in cell wall biosynthesis